MQPPLGFSFTAISSSGAPTPTTAPGTSIPAPVPNNGSLSNGGLSGVDTILAIPMWDYRTNQYYIGTMNYGDFNDRVDDSYVVFRTEDTPEIRPSSISRVVITYRDLGVVTLGWEIRGATQTKAGSIQFGTVAADQRLKRAIIDVFITDDLLRLKLTRAANAGPLGLIKVKLCITVCDDDQL